MMTKSEQRAALSRNIENLRKQLGSTKRHVYTAARMSQGTYDRHISGESDFTYTELLDIAEALGTTVSELTSAAEVSERAA